MKTCTTYLYCLSYYVFQINVLLYMSWHVAQYFKDENLFPMHVLLIAHMPCYLIRETIVHHSFVCSSAVVTLFDCMICLPPYFCNINTNKRVLVNCMSLLKILIFPWLQQQSILTKCQEVNKKVLLFSYHEGGHGRNRNG